MDDVLFQITLYMDGTIRYAGKQPRRLGILAEVMRELAQAIDDGTLSWSDLGVKRAGPAGGEDRPGKLELF